MTTREFATKIADRFGTPQATGALYRALLRFLIEHNRGYSPDDPDRMEVRRHADRNGFFWLPCVLCGRWFSGHEKTPAVYLDSSGIGSSVCDHPDCVAEARRLNEEDRPHDRIPESRVGLPPGPGGGDSGGG